MCLTIGQVIPDGPGADVGDTEAKAFFFFFLFFCNPFISCSSTVTYVQLAVGVPGEGPGRGP